MAPVAVVAMRVQGVQGDRHARGRYQQPLGYELVSHPTAQEHSLEEFKKILIVSGVFFMGLVVLVMSKLQFSTEEVIRWSPIVWLVGVLLAGFTCNGIFYLRRYMKRRGGRSSEQDERRALSLLRNLPSSYPCLAPPPHVGCCRDPSQPLPGHVQLRQLALFPPTYAESRHHDLESLIYPPKYEDVVGVEREEDVEVVDERMERRGSQEDGYTTCPEDDEREDSGGTTGPHPSSAVQ